MRTIALAVLLPVAVAAADAPAAIERGDEAWRRRAEGAQGARAAAQPIGAALDAYEAALAAGPGSLEAHWKLLRATWFAADYATPDEARRQTLLDRGVEVAESALDRLGDRVGGRQRLDAMTPAQRGATLAAVAEAAPVFFWSGVVWGVWGDAHGRLAAARQGVGGTIRDHAETTLALDPGFDHGGGHRLLGRLHSEAPKIPFFTGWVDRDRAIAELENAVARAPDYPFNAFYLADALADHRPAARSRAVELLQRLLARPPAPELLVETRAIQAEARSLLAELSR